MNQPLSSIKPENNVVLGSAIETPNSKSKSSESDHAMYLGMMALIESLGRCEEVGVSIADMSKTLYETLVTNGTEKIKTLQKELDKLGYLLENWDGFEKYITWEKDLATAKADKEMYENLNKYSPYFSDSDKLLELEIKIWNLEQNPPSLPEASPEDTKVYMELMKKFPDKAGMRNYVNAVAQELNSENTSVASNKAIPDSLQQQVKSIVNNQTQISAEITGFLRLIKNQLQRF